MTGVAPTNSGASPPVEMTVAGVPRSASMRATSPSTSPTWPQKMPACIAARVSLPIARAGGSIAIRGRLAVVMCNASRLRLIPAAITPPTKLPAVSTTSKVVAVPKSTMISAPG